MSQEALGQSEQFLDFQERLSRVAPVDRPVLLLGERGTGKELAAQRLHYLSNRWDGPLITLNCATLSPSLIESELFGHERGAFTGADRTRRGRFEQAHGGTLFLDEVGTIPMVAQEKILRFVEYGSFERVGGGEPIEVDVRIICATNADLVAMAEQGEFKRDLLDRLSFEVLFLPPLRHRGEDILLLAEHFAARMAFELGRKAPPLFSRKSSTALHGHLWPGNVRELKNVVERAVYSTESDTIDEVVFDPFISPFDPPPSPDPKEETTAAGRETSGPAHQPRPLKAAVRDLEIDLLNVALASARHNQRDAARMLDLTYDQLRGLIRKYRKELNM